ncbi:uncharacterized protein LOC110419467 [Herrania umbratica]|uniref:Uncharacterized protein LOC110419467 n=1 Tax=Herrania umbratica TaxID=108875 RepID=A0A6J1AMM5_9ROSI|nr:uncharacterized protein LOC110419467 [Herrania umbratica]
MEALWDLEEKWKLTTQEAVLLLACAASAVVGLCAATVLKKKRKAQKKRMVDRDGVADGAVQAKWCEPSCNWVSAKRVLMGSVMWSGANRWGERSFGWEERPPPLLGLEGYDSCAGWRSHNSDSPVWQRPILMGEKCELPRFSGLILYDERGQLLDHSVKGGSDQQDTLQEKTTAAVRTTLRDLL